MDSLMQSGGAFLDTLEAKLAPLQPYAEATTFATLPEVQAKMQTYDLPLEFDVVKYLGVMFMCFPLGIIYQLVPGAFLKHLFNVVTGVVLAQFVFGSQWVHVLAASTFVYLILALTAPIKAFNGIRPLAGFFVMMSYMTIAHLYRLYTDYMGWSLDITGPLMILTIKLSSMGYQYNDGVVEARLVADKVKNGSPGAKRMYTERQDRSISRVPNPLEFFGFVFCPTTFFAGPAFDIREYLDAAERPSSEWAKLPSRAWTVISTGVAGVVFLALTGYGQANFPFLEGTAPNIRVNSVLLNQPTVFHTYGMALVSLFFVRVKYYFAWKLSESSAVLFGFGYNKKTNTWSGAANVDVTGFEFASNLSSGSHAWNKHTQVWLERYVYKRCTRAMSANMLLTYFVSAFWHGFYPGYYLFFMSVPLLQTLSKKYTADVRPRVAGTAFKPIYDVVSIVITHCSLNYLASAFVALGWQNGLDIWNAYLWAGHIAAAAMYLPTYALFKPYKAKTKRA